MLALIFFAEFRICPETDSKFSTLRLAGIIEVRQLALRFFA